MWASHMPYYSEYHSARSERDANPNVPSKSALSTVSGIVPDDMHITGNNNNNNNNNNDSAGDIDLPLQPPANLTELMEPAIDGPPSPERIRQLNDQMKRASHLNRGFGHRAASSSASSLQVSERAAWEQAMENMPLSRRSSNRSAASRSPSQDRPDSMQVLGKNIFHRRAKSSKSGRSKRESSTHSSSGSSLYSTEAPSDNSLANLKDSFMPTIFARRKTSRDETTLQRKLQISGPFNFQHVTHTPRDQIGNLQRGNRMELMAELSTLRVSGPASAPGVINESDEQALHFPNFSAESVGGQDAAMNRPSLIPRQTAPVSGTRRLMKHARSQEQLRTTPPRPVRPPRSPIEQIASPTLGPVPPPRVSSRQSNHRNGSPTAELDRPLTSGGFRRPQPFSPGESPEQPPATSHGYLPEPEFPAVDETRFSHALTTPDNAAWPLATPGGTSYESLLADVPEEEEHFAPPRRSRVSLASNTSSLRASQSVPLLRTMAQSYRMSGASDTLGPSETPATHRTTRSGLHDGCGTLVSPIRENWEDDIDYCYEHEADANFNYEWERPSLDVGRENMAPPPPVQVALVDDELSEAPSASTAQSSPGMLSASPFDVPALSPASQASPPVGHEATTPVSATAVKNNFSLPRGERASRPPNLKHSRSDSRASSFKECHGFTLSPSLLIPNDYHHQMLENEKQEFPNDDEFRNRFFKSNAFFEDNLGVANHQSPFMLQQRASVSTTATNSTTNSTTVSDSTGERHVSGNSTWTTLTRLTSSTSLNKMAGSWSETSDHVPSTHLADPQDDSDQEESTPPASQDNDTVPELSPFPAPPVVKRSFHKSHASESIVRDEVPPMRSPELTKTRRPRARTTSMSQAPPVGQYALFPRSNIKGNGDRI
ncbi:hypothetical protein AK830_g8944 [Neonectria ditissima]|uniref:CRIB domain-containing protein n=1 Tax=Neonectria ditissima TaxID=78410 RepID=A0A0P7B6N4_9HYPO|nr:hypothetical protein AK830_g8944 [Neonectria ditissima]